MQSNKITEWQTITKRIHLRNKNIVIKSLLTFFLKNTLACSQGNISLLRIIAKLFTAIYSKVQKLFRKCFSMWSPPSRSLVTYTLLLWVFTTRRVCIILVPSLLQLLFYNSSSNINESNNDDDNDKTSILKHAESYS